MYARIKTAWDRLREGFLQRVSRARDTPPVPLTDPPFVCECGCEGNDQEAVDRMVEGLRATYPALRESPVIRYRRDSEMCRRVAEELQARSAGNGGAAPLVLLLDRRDDPVTPLLMPWRYQAMIHEYLEIDPEGRVHLQKESEEGQVIDLSIDGDPFFATNAFADFGQAGRSLQVLIDSKNFSPPVVSKHSTLLQALCDRVERNALLEVYEVEENLFYDDRFVSEIQREFRSILELLSNRKVTDSSCWKLVLLFALRFEGQEKSEGLVAELAQKMAETRYETVDASTVIAVVKAVLRSMGKDKRAKKPWKFPTNDVYFQYHSLLASILSSVAAQSLSERDYPFVGEPVRKERQPTEVIVFLVGGATYEESRCVHEMNEAQRRKGGQGKGLRFVLATTSILNSEHFLQRLRELH